MAIHVGTKSADTVYRKAMNLKYAIKHKEDHKYKNILPLLEPQWLKLRNPGKKTEANE